MPTIPSALPPMRRPSMPPGLHPFHSPERTSFSPSARRRGTDRISAIVMSAVSSVSTPGVLVTMIPRARAALRSIWFTPAPKLAISFSRAPACAISSASMLSVTAGTSTSQSRIAAASASRDSGASPRLLTASNRSSSRAITASGNSRVTITRGWAQRLVWTIAAG